jgi:hypothetical protein
MSAPGIGHDGGPPLEVVPLELVPLDAVRVRVLPGGRLDRKSAALYLGRSPKTLSQWVLTGKGPPSHDIGGRSFYYITDCDAFIAARDNSPPATPPVRRRPSQRTAGAGSRRRR